MGSVLPHPHTSGRIAQMRQQAFLVEAERERLAARAQPTGGGATGIAGLAGFVLAHIVRLPWTWRRTRLSTPVTTADEAPVQLVAQES